MISAERMASMACEHIAQAAGVKSITVSHPLNAPTYYRTNPAGVVVSELCSRIDWETRDGRKLFAFLEPHLVWRREKRGFFATLLFGPHPAYQAIDMPATWDKVIAIIRRGR